LRVFSWNLFHGRDAPPDASLFTLPSRLFRVTRRNDTHVQVNRSLFREFASVISGAEWDVAMLQECPPRWASRLASACGAEYHRSLTSRNSFGPLRSLAAAINPDLVGSNEGGSNTTLVRGRIAGRGTLTIATIPERRTAAITRTADGLLVVNIHASNDRPDQASDEILCAAKAAVAFAGDGPIVFGGDLNLRPRETSAFELLCEGYGIAGATTGGTKIDHILSRGLVPVEPPRAWPPDAREVPVGNRLLRISDHAPVSAAFGLVAQNVP